MMVASNRGICNQISSFDHLRHDHACAAEYAPAALLLPSARYAQEYAESPVNIPPKSVFVDLQRRAIQGIFAAD